MSTPSFSSLPPSFNSFPDLEPHAGPSTSRSRSPSRSKHERRDDRKRSENNKKGRREKGEKEKKRKYDDHRADSTRSAQITSDEQLKAAEDRERRTAEGDPFGHENRPLFYSDRKGDPLNVRYGGLYAGDIPRYRLVSGGRKILGLNNAWTVLYRSGKGIEVGVGNRRKQPALTDSNSQALLAAPPTRRLLTTDRKYKYEEIDGFLRLPSRRGRQDDQPYRSIMLSKTTADSNSDTSTSEPEASSDSENDFDGALLTSQQATLKRLEQKLSTDPASISTWLSLLAHSLSNIPITSKNATKMRSEITLAILARALSADPANGTSKKLRLKYLKAGEEVWQETKLHSEWEDALKLSSSVEIWMEWLEWRIRRVVKCVDNIVEDAKRTLDALGDDEESEVGKLRVVWRVAIAFQNAGYVERATALFQAQAELTFKMPQAMYGLPLDIQLDALEELWESEVPRCGESGAIGWATWASSGRPENTSARYSPSQHHSSSDPDPFRKWAADELHADRTMRVPIRSTDTPEDPYATVLFSDIRPLLLCFIHQRTKDSFRFAWLALFGLHIPGFTASLSATPLDNADDRWSFTHLTGPAALMSLFPPASAQRRIAADSHSGVLVGREREYASGFGPVKSWCYGVLGPLDTIGNWGMWGREDVQGESGGFLRRVFEQLRTGTEDLQWDLYALAFEAAVNVKSALKLSRLFLSAARDSVLHWGAHARLERLRGHIDNARKVYETVLTTSPPSPNRAGISSLWWDWAEMEWLAGHIAAAVRVISRSVGVDSIGGVAILRTKRGLEEACRSVPVFRWKEREAWVKMRMLLELLTVSPAAALGVLDAYIAEDDTLKWGSVEHESLTVASATLLYHYGTILRNPLPPAVLRERVEKALERYPSNTALLGMFLEGEKGQGVWGRVRGLFGNLLVNVNGAAAVDNDKDMARRVAEVWVAGWERGRWEGEIERTRSGLAGAVNNERTRGSAILWRIYIEFEIRVGQLQRAKTMLYRAIGECPHAKELYILAFGALRSEFNMKELGDFADAMAGRGIRLRRGLEEMMDWEEEDKESGSEGSTDEIEESAKELRRLMPY